MQISSSPSHITLQPHDQRGVLIGLLIIVLWFSLLIVLLSWQPVDYTHPLTWVGVLLMTHLYTGLFITAHDSMHRVVSRNRRANEWIGRICTILFAYNFYGNLFTKHHEHHRFAGTDKDPDYHHSGNFWIWYYSFARQYINLWQILLMAITYNVLKLWIPSENLVLFWMVPSVLSTFQLFYFGTFLPHRGEHAPENVHRSRSQRLHHLRAFLTCYFFGYHYEHHDSPATPWWLLWKVKEQNEALEVKSEK